MLCASIRSRKDKQRKSIGGKSKGIQEMRREKKGEGEKDLVQRAKDTVGSDLMVKKGKEDHIRRKLKWTMILLGLNFDQTK